MVSPETNLIARDARRVGVGPEGPARNTRSVLARLTTAQRDWSVAGAAMLASVLLHYSNFRSPLLSPHSFRETQTAYTAREFAQHGIDLLHPQLPIFGPPWQVPFEFPAFQALASIPMKLGLSPDASMHLTALACFALSGLLLFGLVRYVSTRVAAFAAVIVFAFSPFALVWGSAGLIEYLVTASGLAFLWAGLVWRDTKRVPLAVVAIVAGSLAMAIKLPSALFWSVPFVLYRSVGEEPGFGHWVRQRLSPRIWAIPLIPLIVGLAWTQHADAIKNASPATRWLASGNLTDWNFGTLEQRGHVANWQLIGSRIENLIVGPYLWIGVIALAVVWSKKRELWIGMVAAALLPIVVFFNLFVVHDYYLIAVTPAVAALAGLGADFLWRAARRTPKTLVGALLVMLWLVPLYWISSDYWHTWAFNPPTDIRPAVQAIRQSVPPNNPVVVQGADWDPTTLYYAERRGLYLRPNIATPAVARLLHQGGFHYWYAASALALENDLLRSWSWVGSVGPESYRMSDAPRDGVETAAFVATSDAETIRIARSQGRVLGPPRVLQCNGTMSVVPTGGPATWLMLSGAERPGIRLSIAPDLAALPGFPALVVLGDATGLGNSSPLTCTGGGAVTVTPIASRDPIP